MRLLDLGCGKAGDLSRWRDNGIEGLLGIDFYDDSLTNSIDGAFSRIMSTKRPTETPENYVFAKYDASLPLTAEGFDSVDEEWGGILRASYGLPGGADIGTREPVAKDGFEIAAAMFTIHYFYESEAKLDGIVENIARNLLGGGVFVGCCFAAERVVDLLGDKQEVEGRAEDGRLMWQISSLESTLESKIYNREIDVFIESINHKISECLVDFDVLQQKLSVHGIFLVESETFDVPYGDYIGDRRRPSMTETQRTFSWLYRYFVFQRKKKE